MRFAVISDIHGNKDALHAVIKDIRLKINDISI
ncbi:YfcE family phosphodiesterase OS=Lysinibacillus sphaericus OX=1421 GN=LS41612_11485 PE=3 SV=1 [Lysinibacillus sphaericus]